MTFFSVASARTDDFAVQDGRIKWPLLFFAAVCLAVAAGIAETGARTALVSVAATLTLAYAGLWLTGGPLRLSGRVQRRRLHAVIGDDPSPAFLTSADGVILYRNPAARDASGVTHGATLEEVLRFTLANPVKVLARLERQVSATGAASETVQTKGGPVHLEVHRTGYRTGGHAGGRAGHEQRLWRIRTGMDKAAQGIGSLPLPVIRIGPDDRILALNEAARVLIGEGAKTLGDLCFSANLRADTMNDIRTLDGRARCFLIEHPLAEGLREIALMPAGPAICKAEDWHSLDALPVPLLKLSRSGEILASNGLARDLLGVETCAGSHFGQLTEGLGRPITDWLDDAAAGRGTIRPEVLRVKRPDREGFVQVAINRAVEADGIVLIAVLNDATELKSLEAQFVQSQKMQAIGQLAGGVAHDFNNLLTAISGHCDLLLLRHDQSDVEYADLMQINQNANRAAALVGQLLAYSRKQTLRPEVIDLRDTLSDLGHLLNRLVGEKVRLSLIHDPLVPYIRADKRQFEQVIMNLVVNARDAMPAGGEIRIETQAVTLDTPLRRDRVVVSEGRYARIQVVDDGHGIPDDKLQKVFEPFFTTKRAGEGTGLGLSTAYGIVKQSGGFIFIDSIVGRGTTFQLLFPAHDREESSAIGRTESTQPLAAHAEGVVLLVEDEAPVRAFASRALQLRGFTVLEAESAEEALALLEDAGLKVDVFVTDVVMPGMDGPGWVLQALERRPDVGVVFVSGYAEESFGDILSRIPRSVFLSKPFSLGELTETVQRQLL